MLFALNRAMGDPVQQSLTVELPVGFERMQAVLEIMLPIKPQRQMAWKVWVAFLGQAVSRPSLLKVQRQRYKVYRMQLHTELTALEAKRLIPHGTNLEAAVAGMIALVDGIGVGYVLEPKQYPPGLQKQLIANHIQTLK